MNHSIFNLDVSQEKDKAHISIFGVIGYDPFNQEERQNTKERMREQIDEIKSVTDADEIYVEISSPGGSVDQAIAIRNILASSGAKIITDVISNTASAGTLIHQIGDERRISDEAEYLIHKPHVLVIGNAFKLRDVADRLDEVEEGTLLKIYSKNSQKKEEAYSELMQENDGNGVWLSAEEIMEYGLADEMYDPNESEVSNLDIAAYSHSDYEILGLPTPENCHCENCECEIDQELENDQGENESNDNQRSSDRCTDIRSEVEELLNREKGASLNEIANHFGIDLQSDDKSDVKNISNQETESEAGETEEDSEEKNNNHKSGKSINAARERLMEYMVI